MYLCNSLPLVQIGWGFLGGLLAGIFITGGRKMLAPIIIKRNLSVGSISKLKESSGISWYISVHVKANIMWNLLASNLEEVRATVDFIEQVDNTKVSRHYRATWVEPDIDDALIALQIGSKHEVRVATEARTGVLKPVNEIQDNSLSGNQDVVLTLTSGSNILGKWLFKQAILGGMMQEVVPTKLRDKTSELLR